jgi:hypothetical protein
MATITAKGQLRGRYRKDKLLDVCRDTYELSRAEYEDTLREGQEIIDMYHNRQYTAEQLAVLEERGQPAETFNVIKLMVNAIIGYLETVSNSITVEPRYPGSANVALVLNDAMQTILDDNDFSTIEKFVKIDGLLTGLMCVFEDVRPTGEIDEFGRPLYKIVLEHIPSWQVRIDPMSQREDYSDARFIHHFKWMSEEALRAIFPKSKVDELVEYYDFVEDQYAEWTKQYSNMGQAKYRQYENYLVVKTIVYHEGKVWSVIWSDETILEKKEITFKDVRFPYRVVKLSKSDKAEYYGPFRDIVETQKAINQALLQIQLLVNTSKAFVEDGAVENLDEFRELFSRVNAIIPVSDLQGIKVEDMSRDIVNQYTILDQALTRIKLVLGVNDSFLGQAYASDSGRKVQIQQQASASQMTMLVDRVKAMFKFIGQDILGLMRQYYRGHQILKVSDPLNSYHYVEINSPVMMPTGRVLPDGSPEMQPVLVPEEDPETNEPLFDELGNLIMVPLGDPDNTIEFADVDIRVIVSRGNQSEERNQVLLETVVNGPVGQVMLQTNPAMYLRSAAMMISEMGTKHSIEIAQMLMQTALGIEQGQIDPRLAMAGGDVQAILGGALGGSTGTSQNSGTQAGSGLQTIQPGKEGGTPGGQ